MRGEPAPRSVQTKPNQPKAGATGSKIPFARNKSHSASRSDGEWFFSISFLPTQTSQDSFGILPTPSPELSPGPLSRHGPPGSAHELFLQNQIPSWEVLRRDGTTGPVSAGTKRSHDYNMDEFFFDMKKRRVNPSYDPREYIV